MLQLQSRSEQVELEQVEHWSVALVVLIQYFHQLHQQAVAVAVVEAVLHQGSMAVQAVEKVLPYKVQV